MGFFRESQYSRREEDRTSWDAIVSVIVIFCSSPFTITNPMRLEDLSLSAAAED